MILPTLPHSPNFFASLASHDFGRKSHAELAGVERRLVLDDDLILELFHHQPEGAVALVPAIFASIGPHNFRHGHKLRPVLINRLTWQEAQRAGGIPVPNFLGKKIIQKKCRHFFYPKKMSTLFFG